MNLSMLPCWSGLCAILWMSAACSTTPESPPPNCKWESGRIDKDTTLYKACSPYEIRGGIDVLNDSVLTIEPGVEVRFGDGDWLEIAAAGTRGARLIARGTAEEPIVLTSLEPARLDNGTWFGLWFNTGTREGSVFSHGIVRLAGGDNKHIKPTLTQGCITLTEVADRAVTIENVVVENCVNAGMILQGSRPVLEGLTFRDMETGFLLKGVGRDAVPEGVQYTNVNQQVVEASQ